MTFRGGVNDFRQRSTLEFLRVVTTGKTPCAQGNAALEKVIALGAAAPRVCVRVVSESCAQEGGVRFCAAAARRGEASRWARGVSRAPRTRERRTRRTPKQLTPTSTRRTRPSRETSAVPHSTLRVLSLVTHYSCFLQPASHTLTPPCRAQPIRVVHWSIGIHKRPTPFLQH